MSKKILIFEAHADDTVIGMGGTVQKLISEGFSVVVITVTSGETAYSSIEMKGKIGDLRKNENAAALQHLGVENHENLNLPCQGVVDTRDLHQKCIELIRTYTPEIIFTHSPIDKHRDHRAISATVTEAWWKATEGVLADRGAPYRAEKLYYFETTEMFSHPDVIIDISPYFEKKMEAMGEYKSQFDVMKGLLSNVEGMAKTRGLYVEGDLGEAFLKSDFYPSPTF